MSIRWSGPVGERQTPKKRSTTLIDRIMRSAAPSAGVKCPVHRTYISQAGDRRHPLRWISQTEVWSAAVRPRVIQSRMEGPPAVGGWEAREEVAPACGRCLPPERHRRGRLGQGGGRRALGRCDTGLLLLLGTRPPPPGANHAHCQPRLASSAERPARPGRRDRPGHSGVAGDQPLPRRGADAYSTVAVVWFALGAGPLALRDSPATGHVAGFASSIWPCPCLSRRLAPPLSSPWVAAGRRCGANREGVRQESAGSGAHHSDGEHVGWEDPGPSDDTSDKVPPC